MSKTRFKRIVISIITSGWLLTSLSGCATYKSSFSCSDAKGAYCVSMDRVDQMIDSGEIESFNEQRLNQKPKSAGHDTLPLKVTTNPVQIINYEADDASN